MGSNSKRPDPFDRSDKDWEKDVRSGKISEFERTASGGLKIYKNTSDGGTKVSHIERENNAKGHRQTDFIIKGGFITEIRPHND